MPTQRKPQPASGMGEALPAGAQPPEQLALPSIPLPPFAPKWPSPHGLEHVALELFLAGEFVDVARFYALTDSTELRTIVSRLIRLGWPLKKHFAPSPVRRNKHRHAGDWFLPKKYIEQAQVQKEAV